MTDLGPLGRLGRYTATHFRTVLVGWVVLALALGFLAPRVEKALSGAGWEATGSQSVQARNAIDRHFAGLSSYGLMVVVHSPTQTVGDTGFQRSVARAEHVLRARRRGDHRGRAPTRCLDLPETATPRSSRPARRATPTTWCARPTT